MPDFSKMPEAFVSSEELAPAVSREVKLGRLRKLGSRLYTRNLREPSERLVQRNLWPLVASYLPGALICGSNCPGKPARSRRFRVSHRGAQTRHRSARSHSASSQGTAAI